LTEALIYHFEARILSSRKEMLVPMACSASHKPTYKVIRA